MSDMYLVLRHRLTEVKQWVTLGHEVMLQARNARGWSYETVARKIPVSSKTYERYEKRGAVPVEMLDKVAAVLGITVERPEFRSVVSLPDEPTLQLLLERVAVQQQSVDELLGAVRRLLQESVAPDRG